MLKINPNAYLQRWRHLQVVHPNGGAMIPKTLTLDHHLVTGYQYLLPVAGLCILQDSGARLGGSCRVGHGQRLKALHAICTVVGQLNGATLCDCDCVIGERDRR